MLKFKTLAIPEYDILKRIATKIQQKCNILGKNMPKTATFLEKFWGFGKLTPKISTIRTKSLLFCKKSCQNCNIFGKYLGIWQKIPQNLQHSHQYPEYFGIIRQNCQEFLQHFWHYPGNLTKIRKQLQHS